MSINNILLTCTNLMITYLKLNTRIKIFDQNRVVGLYYTNTNHHSRYKRTYNRYNDWGSVGKYQGLFVIKQGQRMYNYTLLHVAFCSCWTGYTINPGKLQHIFPNKIPDSVTVARWLMILSAEYLALVSNKASYRTVLKHSLLSQFTLYHN